MCDGRVAVLQSLSEDELRLCPHCGLEVRRVISAASFKLDKSTTPETAAKKGFVTYKKSGKGVYEKVAGEGVSHIIDPESG